jgi:hypothetical protein
VVVVSVWLANRAPRTRAPVSGVRKSTFRPTAPGR